MAIYYIDVDDEITSAAARIRDSGDVRIALVIQGGSRLATSRINFRLLAREARHRGRQLSIIAVAASVRSLAQPAELIRFAPEGPTVIMVAGVNGCGKTTSIAKLTYMFQADGKKVVLGAADTFRAAAVEQLTIWAKRLGAEIVTGPSGSAPASVALVSP